MYTKIVVPLDGSRTAECVLPHLNVVAKGCGTNEVFLVSVTESARVYSEKVVSGYSHSIVPGSFVVEVPQHIGKKEQQAAKYLARIARKLRAAQFIVSIEVLIGSPAQQITGYAEEKGCDLIIMSSHGRSGIDRWAHSIGSYGGVADKVLRASTVPVLMVKATE